MAHLNKNGVNWAIQLKEYQKLQNKELTDALGHQLPFQVFYGRESNAVKNVAQGERCVCESGKSPRTPTKKDFKKNAHKCSKMHNKVKVASQIWDKGYIERRMRNSPVNTISWRNNLGLHFLMFQKLHLKGIKLSKEKLSNKT